MGHSPPCLRLRAIIGVSWGSRGGGFIQPRVLFPELCVGFFYSFICSLGKSLCTLQVEKVL